MGKVLVTEQHLSNIASAIREKLDSEDTYRPGDMAAAIRSIEGGYPEPTGTVTINQNGTANVKDYAQAAVNVQPALQQKTATQNGTVTPDSGYDGLSSVVVDVSGGDIPSNRIIDPSEYEAFASIITSGTSSTLYKGSAYPCNIRIDSTKPSSIFLPSIVRESSSGNSNLCLSFGDGGVTQVIVLFRKIPASANRLYAWVYAKATSNSASSIIGFTTEPNTANWPNPWSYNSQARTRALLAIGPGSSAHVIGQEGVVISVVNENECPYQRIEVDMSGVSVDCYPVMYVANGVLYVREMYYE